MNLGKEILHHSQIKGLTNNELAEKLNMNAGNLSKIKSNSNVRLNTLNRIADALDCEVQLVPKAYSLTDVFTEPTDAQLNMVMEDAISDVNAQNQIWIDKWDEFNKHIMQCMEESAEYGKQS